MDRGTGAEAVASVSDFFSLIFSKACEIICVPFEPLGGEPDKLEMESCLPQGLVLGLMAVR